MALETTYTCTSNKGGQLFFKYDLNGFLIEFKYSGRELTKTAADYIHGRIPLNETLIDWYTKHKHFEVVKGEPDLSFDNFWITYGDKQKKKRSQDLWKKLSNDDKFNAIAYIKRLKSSYRLKNFSMPLPDTYLYNKRWLDEL